MRLYDKEYNQRPTRKLKKKEYNKSLRGKEVHKKCLLKYSEKIKQKDKVYRQRKERRFKTGEKTSRERKLEWKINPNEYFALILNSCYYCKESLEFETGVGLDRINNEIGYLINNVLPCCGECNKARGNRYSIEEFKVMIDALLKYRLEKR